MANLPRSTTTLYKSGQPIEIILDLPSTSSFNTSPIDLNSLTFGADATSQQKSPGWSYAVDPNDKSQSAYYFSVSPLLLTLYLFPPTSFYLTGTLIITLTDMQQQAHRYEIPIRPYPNSISSCDICEANASPFSATSPPRPPRGLQITILDQR